MLVVLPVLSVAPAGIELLLERGRLPRAPLRPLARQRRALKRGPHAAVPPPERIVTVRSHSRHGGQRETLRAPSLTPSSSAGRRCPC